MSRTVKVVITCIFTLALNVALWLFCNLWNNYSSPSNIDEYTNRIDSLQLELNKVSILKDSVDWKIDTVTVALEKTHIQYEKDRTTIINNDTSEDYVFFLNYLRENKSRLDSINNL